VVGLNDCRVTLMLDAEVKVRVEVQYEDRDHAIYDREDDRWFGAEIASTEVDDEIDIEILAEVERKTGTVREAKVLTEEVSIGRERLRQHMNGDRARARLGLTNDGDKQSDDQSGVHPGWNCSAVPRTAATEGVPAIAD
jgi:hypothetical protein